MDYLKDYIEVKDRIKLFYEKYPEGILHFEYKGTMELNNETYIYGKAFAYPDREKLNYASGWAWEREPAKGFARGAEMMTLETSAWGRAIAALGIAVTKGIASREEVQRNVKPENDPWQTPPDSPTKAVEGKISALGGKVVGEYTNHESSSYSPKGTAASEKQVNYLYSLFKQSYSGECNHGDLLKFLSDTNDLPIKSVKEIPFRMVKKLLDNQQLISESVHAWQAPSGLPAADEKVEWETAQF
jgi:hypothetical protein